MSWAGEFFNSSGAEQQAEQRLFVRSRARAFSRDIVGCIGFGDGGLMHTSHLVNARRKTDDRERPGTARSRVETVLVREFTSIFISTRR